MSDTTTPPKPRPGGHKKRRAMQQAAQDAQTAIGRQNGDSDETSGSMEVMKSMESDKGLVVENVTSGPSDGGNSVWGSAMDTANTAQGASGARAPELEPWQALFIEALKKCPVVSVACRAAGNVSRRSAYKIRDRDEAFREAWDDALEEGWDEAERAAYERAVNGTSRPIYARNKAGETELVGYEVETSDRLLELLLKGNRAKTYRETHGPVVQVNFTTVDEAVTTAVKDGLLGEFARKLSCGGESA